MSDARTISFTIDLEDIRPDATLEPRYQRVTEELLELFAARGIRTTFFVVGELARENPSLIRQISAHGHEIALHSLTHTPLTRLSRGAFAAETLAGRDLLGEITGKPVTGYRAPIFSLTRATPWVPETLTELGFRFSSSVLPAGNPLHGFPGAPKRPFRWDCGLIELPAPVAAVGPLTLPVLGGIYFRYLPLRIALRAVRRMDPEALVWNYFHPYDFDAGQPFFRMKNTGFWISMLLWLNRRGTLPKLRAFIDAPGIRPGPPLAERIAELDTDALPRFAPWATASDNGA